MGLGMHPLPACHCQSDYHKVLHQFIWADELAKLVCQDIWKYRVFYTFKDEKIYNNKTQYFRLRLYDSDLKALIALWLLLVISDQEWWRLTALDKFELDERTDED